MKCWFAILALTLPTMAFGGFSNAQQVVGVEKYGSAAIEQLARQAMLTMDRRLADAAILARAGRPANDLPNGIRFTHTGIAVYEPVRQANGDIQHTYTVYNLYQGKDGDPDISFLAQDFVYEMAAGSATGELGILIPTPELQKAMIETIRSPRYEALQNPSYNLLANPYRDQFDNCVSHTLKVIMASIYDTDNEARIYRNIRAYYQAQPVELSRLQQLGLNFMEGITADDKEGDFKTATFLSLKRFLEQNGLLQSYVVVNFDGVTYEELAE